MSVFVPGQQHPELVDGPTSHGWCGDDVLGNRLGEEPVGGHHWDLTRVDPFPLDHPKDPAVVVEVRVGVDDRTDRAMTQVFSDKFVGRGRRFGSGQRVDDHPAGLAADERGVGGIESPNLVEPVAHLVEAVAGVEAGLAPQRRIDRLGDRSVHEVGSG